MITYFAFLLIIGYFLTQLFLYILSKVIHLFFKKDIEANTSKEFEKRFRNSKNQLSSKYTILTFIAVIFLLHYMFHKFTTTDVEDVIPDIIKTPLEELSDIEGYVSEFPDFTALICLKYEGKLDLVKEEMYINSSTDSLPKEVSKSSYINYFKSDMFEEYRNKLRETKIDDLEFKVYKSSSERSRKILKIKNEGMYFIIYTSY